MTLDQVVNYLNTLKEFGEVPGSSELGMIMRNTSCDHKYEITSIEVAVDVNGTKVSLVSETKY